jgi:hypothetical protein
MKMLFLVKILVWDFPLIKLNHEEAQAFNKKFNRRSWKIVEEDDFRMNDHDFRFQSYEFLINARRDFLQPYSSILDLVEIDD